MSNLYILWSPAKYSYSMLYVGRPGGGVPAHLPKHPTTLNSVQVRPPTSQEVSPKLFRGSPHPGPLVRRERLGRDRSLARDLDRWLDGVALVEEERAAKDLGERGAGSGCEVRAGRFAVDGRLGADLDLDQLMGP